MRRLIILLSIILSVTNCKNNKENKEMENYRDIEKGNVYVMSYSNNYCYFEIFIDDIPVHKEYSGYNTISAAFDINQVLFKKGKHKVTYKMYPIGKIEEGEVYDTFPDATYLKLTLESYNSQDKSSNNDVMEYTTPYDKGERFIAAGKTYYEGSFEIDVDVPFNIMSPFANARDLRKMDKKELEAKLFKKYKEIWDIFDKKYYKEMVNIDSESDKIQNMSMYYSKTEIEEIQEEIYEIYKNSSFKMQPIENYKLEIFANGKLAMLRTTNMDSNFRGNSVLWAKVNYDGGIRPFFINNFFYIPEGETEFRVY